MPTRQIVFQSEHLTVVYVEQESSTVVASFNEAGAVAKEDFYAEGAALEAVGATAIGFVSTKANWYPARDMLAAIETVRTRIAGRRTVTFGSGQGGYGALKYAARLSAAISVGFSPQFSINPADVGEFDRRFISNYDTTLANGERVEPGDLAAHSFILFDRLDKQDAAQAAKLMALGRITAIPMPFSGHYGLRQISSSGRMPDFFRLCMSDVRAADLRMLVRQTRSSSSDYNLRLVSHLGDGDIRHKTLFLAAVARMPPGVDRFLEMIRFHLACGDRVRAEQILDQISDEDLLTANLGRAWGSFRRKSFSAGERRIAGMFARRYPNDVYMRQVGVDSLIRVGLREEAFEELQTLQSLDGAEKHQERFIQYYRQLRRFDQVSLCADRMLEHGLLTTSERIKMGFEIAEACSHQKLRPETLRELLRIKSLAVGDEEVALRLAEFSARVGEYGLAGDIALANPALSAKCPVVDVYVAQSILAKDWMDGNTALERLLSRDVPDHTYWEKLSGACERTLGPRVALRAIRRAISLGPKPTSPELIFRLSVLLFHCRQWRKAAHEMRSLVDTSAATGHLAATIVHLALAMGQKELATTFVTKWVEAHPSETADAAEMLEGCKLFLKLRKMNKVTCGVNELLARIDLGLPMDKKHFEELVEITQALNFEMEDQAVRRALDRYPQDDRFLALSLKDRNDFARALFRPASKREAMKQISDAKATIPQVLRRLAGLG